MELGLKNDEARLFPHCDEWHTEFIRVKQEIQFNTGIAADRIEHIGSTAIKEMPAKPILDIVVAVNDIRAIDDSTTKGLKKSGFLRLRVQLSDEVIFAKFKDDTYEVKTHYIHLVNYGSQLWHDLIFFRDYLNSNAAEREAYKNLKLDYVRNHGGGIDGYTAHKEQFVKSIYARRS